VNFLSINLVALATFWYQGYQPEQWFDVDAARRDTAKRIGVLALTILILSTVLAGATYASTQRAAFADEARMETESLLEGEPSLSMISFEVEHGVAFPFRSPEEVVVTVGHPPGVEPPALADRLAERIDAIENGPFGIGSGEGVAVSVRYTAVETAGGEAGSRDASGASAPQALREGGMSGSQSTASTTVSRTPSTFSPSVTLM
jgi:hypothetical protein